MMFNSTIGTVAAVLRLHPASRLMMLVPLLLTLLAACGKGGGGPAY